MILREIQKSRKRSKHGNRFFTSIDMASIKHDESVVNSQIKRGLITRSNTRLIIYCSCGVEGCFIHTSIPNEALRKII